MTAGARPWADPPELAGTEPQFRLGYRQAQSDAEAIVRLSMMSGSEVQATAARWCGESFGAETLTRLDQRAARVVEEAIELAQVAGVTIDTVLKIAGYVFARPPGTLQQEVGGLRMTTAIFCECARVSGDMEERVELARVLSLPKKHFTDREKAKREQGASPAIDTSDAAPDAADIVGRLRDACVGYPAAEVPWPHRLLHEAAAEIEALRHAKVGEQN